MPHVLHVIRVFVYSFFLFSVVIGVANDSLGSAASGNPEAGEQIYGESCEHCHGYGGDGRGQMAEYLTPSPAKLTSEGTQSKSDDELKAIILHGRPGTAMAGFEGALEGTQLADLLAYLRTLKP